VTTAGSSVAEIALGDLNNDGILDIATANSSGSSGTVSTVIARGGGSFAAATTYVIGGDAGTGVSLGDVDGDGYLDLAGSDNDGNYVVRRGNGNGTLGATLGTGADGDNRDLILADLNGDGRADVVQITNANELYVSQSQANGTLGTRSLNQTVSITTNRLTLNDFDGDGILDALTGDGSSSALFLGNGKDGSAPLLPFSLLTKADALQAYSVLDNALTNLSKQRGVIGAYQSRIASALNTLSSTTENYRVASSRIRDTDVAEDSSKLIRSQILQQAATAVLAQSNQSPRIALQLLESN
jgi:flagellin-like hook-associated protein FlgL